MLRGQTYRFLWLAIPQETTLNSAKQKDAYDFVKLISTEVL